MSVPGKWIGIGGHSARGFGGDNIEVQVARDGAVWEWLIIPHENIPILLGLLNDNPEIRDRIIKAGTHQ